LTWLSPAPLHPAPWETACHARTGAQQPMCKQPATSSWQVAKCLKARDMGSAAHSKWSGLSGGRPYWRKQQTACHARTGAQQPMSQNHLYRVHAMQGQGLSSCCVA
jgi:hypothetical protein